MKLRRCTDLFTHLIGVSRHKDTAQYSWMYCEELYEKSLDKTLKLLIETVLVNYRAGMKPKSSLLCRKHGIGNTLIRSQLKKFLKQDGFAPDDYEIKIKMAPGKQGFVFVHLKLRLTTADTLLMQYKKVAA